MKYNDVYNKLKVNNQLQLLKWYDSLDPNEKNKLLENIDNIDFSIINSSLVENEREIIEPIKTLTINEIEKEKEDYKKIGLSLLSSGHLACILLAGGMGSRLGFDKPKGMYNIGLTKTLSIFECQFNTIKDIVTECNNKLYVFIMTSPINDKDTRDFFESNNYFGYDKNYVKFFIQDEFPVTDLNGKALLANKYTPLTAPNGNGGWFLSMKNAGFVDFCKDKGIRYFNVYAVDNVLQKIADPVFLGATYKGNFECGAKVVRKVDVDEKVGVICLSNGHPSITEYIDLTDEIRYSKDENGEYLYNFGVILNYIFKIDALERTVYENFQIHKAIKKITYMNENGEILTPLEPNAIKYETFILDMIKMMSSCLPFEVDRNKEFAPIKNLHGTDSVDSARKLLVENGIEL